MGPWTLSVREPVDPVPRYNPHAMDHEDFSLHERLTRSLAYMLRHQPDEFDLEVDRHGWADLDDVVRALNERVGSAVSEDDVHEALHAADKPRYELKDGKIRALYGHSIEIDPGEPDEPPDELYAVVRGRDVPNVERDGLKGVRRTFIHLSLTKEEAREAGRRLDRRYAVVTVLAGDAWEEDIDFYDRTSMFLSDDIPTEFIDRIDEYDDGVERERRGGRDRGGRGRGRDRGRDGRRRRGRRSGGRDRDDSFEREERFEDGSADEEVRADIEDIDEVDDFGSDDSFVEAEKETVVEERKPKKAKPAKRAAREREPQQDSGFGTGLDEAPAAAVTKAPAPEPTPEPSAGPEPSPTGSSEGGFGVGLD